MTEPRKERFPLYAKIIAGLMLGVLWGIFAPKIGISKEVSTYYIKPFGDIFIRLLKMIAVPLILASLIVGITNLKDLSKLSRMGTKTIGLYLLTTLIAITIGLAMVNVFKPGEGISDETKTTLQAQYQQETSLAIQSTSAHKESGPLDPLVNMIPDNILQSFSGNQLMLQTVFFALFFGITLLYIDPKKSAIIVSFFDALNDAILKMIDFIMQFAPIGVFALIAAQITQIQSPDLLIALAEYSLIVIASLAIMIFFYWIIIATLGKISLLKFIKGIFPAQLLAFSSSSSSATLPVTMKQCEGRIGIHNEVSSFVLPLGATINMDGTSLYQAIATVFIAQVYSIDLTFADQLAIVFTALLSSIGAAGVPGAGMILLGVILAQQNIPLEGIALILAPDRILDMCRTTINVTGDATVATIVAGSENKLYHIK